MPQRFLKPGITNSERWNGISWQAQSLYIRILTIVDDYGRYDGRSPVIHGVCFSLYNAIHPDNPVHLQETDKMLQEIAAIGLVEIYDSCGKRVMQLTQWTERLREGVKEKWPARNNAELLQLPAETCKILPSPSSSPSTSSPPSTPLVLEVQCIETRRVTNDSQWLELLQNSEGYRTLDVKAEYSKAECWCQVHRKKLSRRRFLAWLNKSERPLQIASNGNGHLPPNGAQLISWNQELGRVIAKMDKIVSQYGDHQSWDQKDRTRFNELAARKKELKDLIGAKE